MWIIVWVFPADHIKALHGRIMEYLFRNIWLWEYILYLLYFFFCYSLFCEMWPVCHIVYIMGYACNWMQSVWWNKMIWAVYQIIYLSIHFHLSSWWDCGADSLSWEAYRSIISQAHPRSSLGPSPGTTGQENVSQKAF